MHRETNGYLVGAVEGAIAGAVGTVVMDKVSTYLYDLEDPATVKQEEAARVEGKDPASVAAGRLADAIGAEPGEDGVATAASAIHYALGVVPGVIYGAARPHLGGSGITRGLLYGLALFLVNDEALGPALGLAAPPQAYPWQAHARGLAAHLALGVTTEALMTALDALGPERTSAARYRAA